jgi:hypothetical protein
MQQRRVRLGDILDDYCPRERRVTNHAVVAMIDDEVKQTRCTTCDADHEYKHAKVPSQRRKRVEGNLVRGAAGVDRVESEAAGAVDIPPEVTEPFAPGPAATSAEPDPEPEPDPAPPDEASTEEEGPVHRRLIRATLPRPDGQPPERREPEFTIRQPGFRGRPFDQKNGQRQGRRQTRGQGGNEFGGPRHGSGQPPRHGSGQGSGGSGFRSGGNRPSHPAGPRGPRHGAGRGGRKRSR